MIAVTRFMAKMEELLAALFEGTVERAFRVRVQPAHIARRLEKALEEGALVGVEGLIAPNHFVVKLDTRSYRRLSGALPGIRRDLERHLVPIAARRRARNLEPFSVEIEEDPALRPESFTVSADFVSVQGTDGGAAAGPEHTIPMPVVSATPSRPPALLELKEHDGTVRIFALAGSRCTIGRAMDNDVVLPESAVSRYHAAVRITGDGYLVEDLGSTNGLFLNGKPVKSTVVRDGDRLQVGAAELVFRQR